MYQKLSAAFLCILAALPGTAGAAVFNVPDGDYEALRGAVRQAESNNEADTILLAPGGVYFPSDKLSLGRITTPIAIYGRGATIIGDQAGDEHMTIVSSSGKLTIADLNILNITYAVSESGFAGGVLENRGTTRLRNVTITDTDIDATQNAISGGVLANSGTLSLENVTLSGNRLAGQAVGVALHNTGQATLVNVTIAGNRNGSDSSPAIHTGSGASLSIGNSILADNAGGNCNRSASSNGGNVSDDGSCGLNAGSDQSNTDPMLEALNGNGGSILTHRLAGGSPAVNAGRASGCTPMDARGMPRPNAGASGAGRLCDAGAHEVSEPPFEFRPPSTGSWFNPEQSGHGFMLEFLPDGRVLATWFVFNNAGQRDWIQAQGLVEDDIAKLDAYQVEGGQFPPNFDPDAAELVYWGTLSLVLYDCQSGAATWMPDRPGYRPGGMALTRLSSIAGQTCP